MQRLPMELSAIPRDGISQRYTSTEAGLDLVGPEFALVQPCEIECQFYKINHEVVVHGTLYTVVGLTCSRCAEEFERSLNVALDAVYLPMDELSSARAKELEEGEADVYPYAEQVIDIAEMVRDKLLLSIPLQPHCMTGCKGLCPSCGVNRNAVSCQCAEERLGSPFDLLKDLRFS